VLGDSPSVIDEDIDFPEPFNDLAYRLTDLLADGDIAFYRQGCAALFINFRNDLSRIIDSDIGDGDSAAFLDILL
jgi:hypothetical protein